MKPSEVINKMKSDLFEAGWCQGVAENEVGRRCLVGSKRYVLEGGVYVILSDDNKALDFAVTDVIEEAIDSINPDFDVLSWGDYIPDWNDVESRNFSEVIDMLDKAEKLALIKESK